MKRGIPRELNVEGLGPDALEVDGIGQNQAGCLIQAALRDQVMNLVLGLLGDPGVDGLAGLLSLPYEINLAQFRPVTVACKAKETGQETSALLSPKSVGFMQPVSTLPSTGVQGLVQRGES